MISASVFRVWVSGCRVDAAVTRLYSSEALVVCAQEAHIDDEETIKGSPYECAVYVSLEWKKKKHTHTHMQALMHTHRDKIPRETIFENIKWEKR